MFTEGLPCTRLSNLSKIKQLNIWKRWDSASTLWLQPCTSDLCTTLLLVRLPSPAQAGEGQWLFAGNAILVNGRQVATVQAQIRQSFSGQYAYVRWAISLSGASHQRHYRGGCDCSPPRFHGSYLNLHYGFLPDALVDLTGGVVTGIDLHSFPSDLVMMVNTAAKTGSLMTCGTPASVSRLLRLGRAFPHPGMSSHQPIQPVRGMARQMSQSKEAMFHWGRLIESSQQALPLRERLQNSLTEK